ncbi:MAG: hypothetical protein OEQ25_18305, partial [Gammaproteobacteria bacterium]|nr:hypothetical protein [Gammaproteobacteria bacterium]
VVGFWCIGMPVSLWLGFARDLGAPGLWWGFVAALGMVAIILLVRLKYLEQREVIRVIIDEHAHEETAGMPSG